MKIVFLFLFFASCGSHIIITPTECLTNDSLVFYKPESRWFTYDPKKKVNSTSLFRYSAKTHSFFGETLSSAQTISPCEIVGHQKAKEITIDSHFTFDDILWGFIPGYSPRTVTVNGEFELEDMN